VSVLTDQVEAQGEKIRDLESSLEEHHHKLISTEEMLQQVRLYTFYHLSSFTFRFKQKSEECKEGKLKMIECSTCWFYLTNCFGVLSFYLLEFEQFMVLQQFQL